MTLSPSMMLSIIILLSCSVIIFIDLTSNKLFSFKINISFSLNNALLGFLLVFHFS